MIDVSAQINAVRRRVGRRELESGEVHVVALSQTYDTGIDDMWDACTNPERLPRWFLPVTGELRLGGRYQLEGNAGGTIERCDPPKSFAVTWEYGESLSWVEVRLSPEPDGQTRFDYPSEPIDFDAIIARIGRRRWRKLRKRRDELIRELIRQGGVFGGG